MRRILSFLSILVLVGLLPVEAVAQVVSQRAIVLLTGGGSASANGTKVTLSAGQSAIGTTSAGGNSGQIGFWYAAAKTVQTVPQTTTVTLGDIAATKNHTFPVPLSLNLTGGLVAATFKIDFDQSKLSVAEQDLRTTDLTERFVIDADVKQNQGKIAVSIAGAEGLPAGSGVLIEIPVRVKGAANIGDIYPLTFTEALLVYDDGTTLNDVIPDTEDGSITIVEPGDINQDGVLDLKDVVFTMRVIAGTLTFSDPFDAAVADADHNGIVTIDDALFLLRSLTTAKLIPGGLLAPVAFASLELETLPGDRITVPIRIDEAHHISAMDLVLRYDPTALRLDDVVYPEGMVVHNTQTPGEVRLVGLNLQGLASADGRLGELVFTAQSEGQTAVEVAKAHLLDPIGSVYPVLLPGAEIAETPLPKTFTVLPNYPNPFNPETIVRYALPQPAAVRIAVYNALGQPVEKLVQAFQPAGHYRVVWQAGENAPGLYFVVVESGGVRKTMKMMLLK